MNKMLVSWVAQNHDFNMQNGLRLLQVNEAGPNFSVHKFHWDDYTDHLLLYNEPNYARRGPIEAEYVDVLRSALKGLYPHRKITAKKMEVLDPINVEEISQKVQDLLAELTVSSQVDIFISPGTPAMQVAWYINGINFKEKVTLFQGREGKFAKSGKHEKVIVGLSDSMIPRQLSVANNLVKEKQEKIIVPYGMETTYTMAKQVAGNNAFTCLVLGPNGSGKEKLARYIHDESARREQPFIAVNCAAFTDELLSSELFGHMKGAFTGAEKNKTGIFKEAEGGTVFLDEIGDISPRMQVALLRVLQEKEIRAVGSNVPEKIDVRIVAATNKDLKAMAVEEKFRWDLYYRLNVATIHTKALAICGPKVIRQWIDKKIAEYAYDFGGVPLKLSADALKKMCNYHWPGNIRELEHCIIRLYTFRTASDTEIVAEGLPDDISDPLDSNYTLDGIIKSHIVKVYKQTDKTVQRTARLLGIAPNSVRSKLKEYGILVKENAD